MSYQIKYLPAALHDLTDTARYIGVELHNPDAADRLAEKIVTAVDSLANMPYGFAVYRPAKPMRLEYRRVVADSYVVFYWVDEEKQKVTIARAIYGGRRVEDMLE